MTTLPQTRYEVKTRVSFFLPINNGDEERAFLATLRYLREQRTGQVPVTGFTTTTIPNTGFSGEWWDEGIGDWLREMVALCIVDYPYPFYAIHLQQALAELKQAIDEGYEHYTGRRQTQLWIIAQEALLYA